MGLTAYRNKRHFGRTSEPRGKIGERQRWQYVIQRHAASHLHYDFRLALDGVLKSWAIPKGPSLDPRQKRLAVEVEDYPLEYGSFEGVIPEGQYGAGTVMLWDQGHWQPDGDPHEGLQQGKLAFHLEGSKLHGGWILVRSQLGSKGKNAPKDPHRLKLANNPIRAKCGMKRKQPRSSECLPTSAATLKFLALRGLLERLKRRLSMTRILMSAMFMLVLLIGAAIGRSDEPTATTTPITPAVNNAAPAETTQNTQGSTIVPVRRYVYRGNYGYGYPTYRYRVYRPYDYEYDYPGYYYAPPRYYYRPYPYYGNPYYGGFRYYGPRVRVGVGY
jgi:DNA ligase D-like protein (predicted 3'-phosphoesterase)